MRLAGAVAAMLVVLLSLAGDGQAEFADVNGSGELADAPGAPLGISNDGRLILFVSRATNLAAGGGDNQSYIRDRVAGTTTRLGIDAPVALSGDGRFALLIHAGLSVLDRQTGDWDPVTTDGYGEPRAISDDGRYVVFRSDSALVPGDLNAVSDVYVRDRAAATTTLVSAAIGGAAGNGPSQTPAISGDGTVVTFSSRANDLVVGDTNGEPDIFARDLPRAETEIISVDGDEQQEHPGPGFSETQCASSDPSADGSVVAFACGQPNLAAPALPTASRFDHAYIRDRVAGTTVRADIDAAGIVRSSSGQVLAPSISGDGRRAAFWDNTTYPGRILLWERGQVSVTDLGDSGQYPLISGDGTTVTFQDLSDATFGGSHVGVDDTDTLAPETTLLSAPPLNSNSNAATFAFATSEPEPAARVRFECRLDVAAFSACRSPLTYTVLSQGSHVFYVRAVDASGNVDPSPVAYAWTVDATPPQTTITSGPAVATNATSATLAFSASPEGGTFECRLDAAAFAPCTSPAIYAGLTAGSHGFAVRAIDLAGNTDLTPATRSWTIDRTPPDTVLDGGPTSPSADISATLFFSSEDASATFECRLDGGPYAGCTSPRAYGGLLEGPHTFRVRAIDPAGNTDPTEVSHTWRIETAPPETTIVSGPEAFTASTSATLVFESNEPGSFDCRLDGQALVDCASPASYAGLSEGGHSFEVGARDLSNKVDLSPASWSWTVDLAPPAPTALAQPGDGAASLPVSPVFSWAATTDDRTGVDRYELWIDGALSRTLSSLLCGRLCSVAPLVALADGPHSWQVRAVDGVGNRGASATRAFGVDAAPPAAFSLAAPQDDAALASRRPLLSWRASADGGVGLAGYDVLIDDQVVAAGLGAGATTFAPVADLPEGVHRWRVVARDGYGNERSSAHWRFTVDVTPPGASFTAAPNPVLAGRSVTFSAAGSGDGGSGIVRHEWDLDGDGTFERDTGATPSTTSVYPDPGIFAVQLRITDRAGLTNVTRIDERVNADPRSTEQPGVSINGGAEYTNSPVVTINARWPRFATQMLISNDGGFRQPRVLPLLASTPWTLSTVGAERTLRIVYVRFIRGNTISEDYTDDIVLDERAPQVTSARVVPKKGSAPVLQVVARDRGLAGVAGVQVTNNRAKPGARFRTSDKLRAQRATITLTRRRGERRLSLRRTIYVRARDRAGNLSAWRVARTSRPRPRGRARNAGVGSGV